MEYHVETTIKVDPEVFGFLQKHAKPFVDTPNSTLRRLLGIDKVQSEIPATSAALTLDALLAKSVQQSRFRSKAPKAELPSLVRAGLVKNNEKLYLVDYQGKKHQEYSAVITGGGLFYNGQSYSMSNLAQELLAKLGFRSNSVRGPAHWVNEAGTTVRELWEQYQMKQKKNERVLG